MYRIGHSSPQAALRYQHATARRDAAIAEGISDLIRRERLLSNGEGHTEQLGHDGLSGRVEGPGSWALQRPDEGLRVERATGIEPAFSAWEAPEKGPPTCGFHDRRRSERFRFTGRDREKPSLSLR